MTRVAVFAGPSVPPALRDAWSGMTWLPPAQAGDFLKILGHGFDIVALIDGYFDHCPAPWHKEILAVMEAGICVVGASSMGALRAAELDGHGMVGVGTIYSAYRQGLLTGDDEVALVHAPESLGWEPLSVPMIEVRATLALALRRRLLGLAEARRLRCLAHDIHFVDRDWPLLCAVWLSAGVDESVVRWLARHHVQLKRADAMACIDMVMSGSLKGGPVSPVPRTIFLQRLQEFSAASA